MSAKNNIPRDEKQYRKTRRTIKLVVYMVLSTLAVLLVGLVFVWMYDKAPGNPFSHGWNLFFVIVFAVLVACLQLPGYIMDIRKIEISRIGIPLPIVAYSQLVSNGIEQLYAITGTNLSK